MRKEMPASRRSAAPEAIFEITSRVLGPAGTGMNLLFRDGTSTRLFNVTGSFDEDTGYSGFVFSIDR